MKELTEQLKQTLRRKKKRAKPTVYLSTGSTTLNLACSGRPEGAFPLGSYIFFVGDSTSGKTFFGMTALAEASINSLFDGYRLIHDDVEGGALMDFNRYFGSKLANRIEPPEKDKKGNPIYSRTVEQFYFHLQDAFDDGHPFIYLADSQDAMSSEQEGDKFDKRKKAFEKGESTTGTYGDGKPKVHSANIRRMLGPLSESGSILIMLNQTRDSFDIFEKSTYSGGRAIKFYATVQLWSTVKQRIKRQIKGKERQLGVNCRIQVKKNRITGREDKMITVPIYHSYGVDDLGSMIDYLTGEKVWKKVSKTGIITATGLGPAFDGKAEQIIQTIQDKELEEDLRELVVVAWNEIEQACKVKRKNRYG